MLLKRALLQFSTALSLAVQDLLYYTGRLIIFFLFTSIYNKKTKGPTLVELFTATGKLKKFFFDN
jgi:hypothetical protein